MDLTKLIWILLLSAPAAALVAHLLINSLPPLFQRRVAKTLAVLSAALLIVVLLAAVAGIRFVPILANIWMLAAAYFGYSFLVLAIERLPSRRMIRLTALVFAALPIAYGYFMSSVGLLALTFTAGLYVDPPLQTVRLNANTICVMTNSGWLDSGHFLRVHHEWPLLPLLHRQTQVIPLNIERPSAGLTDCNTLRGTKL